MLKCFVCSHPISTNHLKIEGKTVKDKIFNIISQEVELRIRKEDEAIQSMILGLATTEQDEGSVHTLRQEVEYLKQICKFFLEKHPKVLGQVTKELYFNENWKMIEDLRIRQPRMDKNQVQKVLFKEINLDQEEFAMNRQKKGNYKSKLDFSEFIEPNIMSLSEETESRKLGRSSYSPN